MSQETDSANGSTAPGRIRNLAGPIFYLSRNIISMVGVVIATSLFGTMVMLYLVDFYGLYSNPYIGIIAYMILPSLFLLGLILVPVGMLWEHHRQVRAKTIPEKYPKINFNQPEIRRVFNFVVLATGLNGLIFVWASYRGVTYMDSVTFCGRVCHQVMQPEYTAYKDSPHSRVECVSCHIGPGASWFVKSKLSGLGQVVAVALQDFPRPIPTPIKNLRPARETCEQCHWPSKFSGSLLLIKSKYAEDKANTMTKDVLMLKVGGGSVPGQAIHSTHLDLARNITYITTDRSRQTIPWVRYTSITGKVTEYATPGWNGEKAGDEVRTMDCMDCHNRPTHTFQLPEDAVDQAMSTGRIATSLPFVKKEAILLIKKDYRTQAAGAAAIEQGMKEYYQKNYPAIWNSQRKAVEQAAVAVRRVYQHNVFPEMKISWGTYPNNIGHINSPGCFRCHDGNHISKEGKAITQSCTACHLLLALDDPNPKVLEDLSLLKQRQSGVLAKWASPFSKYRYIPNGSPLLAALDKAAVLHQK